MKIFSEVIHFWIDTWRTDRLLFISEMVGALCALTASYMLPLHVPMIYIYLTYLVSNIAFLHVGYRRKSSWVLLMTLGFLVANAYGLAGVL